ncbi:Protein kinase domain-containing protein [Thermomonospora echinospora]|uniref:Protein kinase domain-containing protein n=1 Tax=Thermomonospora echinospora TaxID=1992 RepID=A0A1H6EA78_9ACTN|nr:protein kinase [Thermomonospora echinospora]SEG93826.1 Protein kinase domain-containing protein [Thermomonospora echinospora]
MLGRTSDPQVVRLYRMVKGERSAVIAMEAVNGVSLREFLAEHATQAPETALTVLKGSPQGLAAAHAVGVVHRDHKLANLVVQADGPSKPVDSGVAVLAGDGSQSGTPSHRTPEPLRPTITRGMAKPASDRPDSTHAFMVELEMTARAPYAATGRHVAPAS